MGQAKINHSRSVYTHKKPADTGSHPGRATVLTLTELCYLKYLSVSFQRSAVFELAHLLKGL